MIRRALLTALALWLAAPAFAQWPSTRANQVLSRMFTQGGHFGPPPYASDPFTCDATTKRTTYYNTTSNTIVFCNGTSWTAIASGGSLPVVDTTAIVKGSVDETKQLRFEVDGFTAGATRVLTAQNMDYIIARVTDTSGGIQVLPRTGTNAGIYFGGNSESTAMSAILHSLVQTPDSTFLVVNDAFSRAVTMIEDEDQSTDFAHPNPPHPTFFWQTSDATVVTQYTGASASGLQGELFKTLTEAAATSVVQIPVASDTGVGGMLAFTVFASDGTAQQLRTGRAQFAAVAEGVTETCTITDETDGSIIAATTGTLTYTVACDTTPANAVNLQINATSSLVQTTLRAYYRLYMHGPVGAGVLPQ